MSSYYDYINLDRPALLALLEEKMDKQRYEHVLRVEATGLELARQYGESQVKTSIACLLHDAMKNESDESSRQTIISTNLPLNLLDYGNAIWHGPLAAVFANKQLDLSDEDILNAIANHTYGSDHMSVLEQIVFVADYIEPERDFPAAQKARLIARKNLLAAVGYISQQTLLHLVGKRQRIYPQSFYTYNAYTTQLGEEWDD